MLYSCTYFTVSLTAKIEMFIHEKIKYDLCEFLWIFGLLVGERDCSCLRYFVHIWPNCNKTLLACHTKYAILYVLCSIINKNDSKIEMSIHEKMTIVNFWLIGWWTRLLMLAAFCPHLAQLQYNTSYLSHKICYTHNLCLDIFCKGLWMLQYF
jgi:hypothetical protein